MRGATYYSSFIEHWLLQLLYQEAADRVLISAYSAFGILLAISWWVFPAKARRR